MRTEMPSSLEIAQAALRPIEEIASAPASSPTRSSSYGRTKAKMTSRVLDRLATTPDGKLIA